MKRAETKSPAKIYLVFALILIVCGLFGGIAGYTAVSHELSILDFAQQVNRLLAVPGPWWYLPAFLLLTGSTWVYIRGNRLIPQALEDDERFSQVNLTLEHAMFLCNLSSVFLFLAMALSYAAPWGIGWSVLLLTLLLVWMIAIQAQVVSATKKMFPEKQGNIFDRKFQRDWYESCDEAERQQIAQCSYQVFKVMSKIFPGVMAVLAILSTIGLVAPTYSLLVGSLWLVQQFVYHYTALHMDKQKS